MRRKPASLSSDSEAIDPVRVLEEFGLAWVSLDVTPATLLPAARHELQVLVHQLLGVHVVKRVRIHHSWNALPSIGWVESGWSLRAELRSSRVLVASVVRGRLRVVHVGVEDLVAIGSDGVKATGTQDV